MRLGEPARGWRYPRARRGAWRGGRWRWRHNGRPRQRRRRERDGRRCRRRSACDRANRLFEFGSNSRQRGPDRHLGVQIDEKLLDFAGFEDFDLDRAFLCLDDGDDVAAFDAIAGLDQPFHQRACFHICAEGGHAEIDHGVPSTFAQVQPWRPRRSWAPAGSPRSRGGGDTEIGTSALHTRPIGASSSQNACSMMRMPISADRLPLRQPSSMITARRVLATDAIIVASSSGLRLRKSITSASIFSPGEPWRLRASSTANRRR